ncbi:hypothetical protein JHK82_050892 [Glycine max]|nr:hypothetical protein JHK82_050892 [Glycine max]
MLFNLLSLSLLNLSSSSTNETILGLGSCMTNLWKSFLVIFVLAFGHLAFHPLQKIFEVIGPLLDHITPSLFKKIHPQIKFIIYMRKSEVNINKSGIDLILTMKLKVISSIIDHFNHLKKTMPLGCNIKCLSKLKLIFL